MNDTAVIALSRARTRRHEGIALPPWPGAAEAFDAAIEALIGEFGAEEIWVFGSCARGTPTRDSDVDLMIVRSARPGCLRPSWEALAVIRPFHRIPMDLFVITPELWGVRRQKPQGLYLDIVRNGKRIYARQD
ncbi:MAG: nucleotidyltransferase domain-containing protein [Chloroflexi bacterium]|nr:nucleotidyltransferase domain-containing protein [Chloroflexota bacterium]